MPADRRRDLFAKAAAPRRQPRRARPAPTPIPATMSWPMTTSASGSPRIGSEPSTPAAPRASWTGCPTSSSRQSSRSQPPTPLGRSSTRWPASSLTPSRRGTTIDSMLIATSSLRIVYRSVALPTFVLALATTALGAMDAASRKEAEEWRKQHEASYRKEYVPLAGLFALKPGPNTAGSAAGNAIVLPKAAPSTIGRFVLTGKNVRFEPQPGTAVAIKGRPVTSAVALKSDIADDPDELAIGDIALW